jgi:hypothetical protein
VCRERDGQTAANLGAGFGRDSAPTASFVNRVGGSRSIATARNSVVGSSSLTGNCACFSERRPHAVPDPTEHRPRGEEAHALECERMPLVQELGHHEGHDEGGCFSQYQGRETSGDTQNRPLTGCG